MNGSLDVPVPFPADLAAVRGSVQTYVNARIKQFAGAFARRLPLNINPAQLDGIMNETMASLASQDAAQARSLRLVLRHDCQSTGCGETGCLLCQYNPSRLCKRNIKNKYLIDDHLKAKCGAPLRVELVDESNACVVEGLPHGMQLEVHVMNGEKYKEICPENTLLTHSQLRSCIISHHTRALLRRDGGSDDQLRCFLQLERGQAVLSDLQVTTSSEALLAGKAPTFRLLIWAVDAHGEPVPSVTYVVSEYFVVATKRVKHAIKSDIPSVADHVSKLVHIGKATVDKLLDLRQAAAEEGFDINVPDELNRIEKVGQFQQLVELSEVNTDLKNKVRHLLKLSPEKWEEVANHAQAAVMPDFRPRAWWCPALKAGLLFSCKNGAVCMDQPIALVKMGGKGEEDQVIPIAQLDVQLFNTIPKLKQQAHQSWYAAQHPGWAIYYKEGQDMPAASGNNNNISNNNNGGGQSMSGNAGGVTTPGSAGGNATSNTAPAPRTSAFSMTQAQLTGGGPRLPTPPPMGLQLPVDNGRVSMGGAASNSQGAPGSAVSNQQQQPNSNPPSSSGAAGAGPNARSPFAMGGVMGNLTDHFPQWSAAGQNIALPAPPPGAANLSQDSISALLKELTPSMTLNPGSMTLTPGSMTLAGGGGGAGGGMGMLPSGLGIGVGGGAGGMPGYQQVVNQLKSEDLPAMERGMSQQYSLLGGAGGGDGMQAGWQLPPMGGLDNGSLSLNQPLNALLGQDSMDRNLHSYEPPNKMQRTSAGGTGVGGIGMTGQET